MSIVEPGLATPLRPEAFRAADLFSDTPVRLPLCGPDRLAEVAHSLAEGARVRKARGGRKLLARLHHNARVLREAHAEVLRSVARREPLLPDAEWLLDNFYVVEEVLREAVQDLPPGYLAQLPELSDGPFAGTPRVYELAAYLVGHTDSFLQMDTLVRTVHAYQEAEPLGIGELWALPTVLRMLLLENLGRLAAQLLRGRTDRAAAADLARTPAGHFALPDAPSDAFLVALQQAFRDQAAPAETLQEWMARHAPDTVDALRREHQRQAANQVTIGNCITSLRLLNIVEWPDFVERLSVTEAVLRDDPSGTHPRSDFPTRDRARRVVERLSRRGALSEPEVARAAIERAAAQVEGHEGRVAAYWLIGDGRREFARIVGYRPSLADRVRRLRELVPGSGYAGLIGLLTLGLLFLAAWLTGANPYLVGLLGILPALDVAVAVANWAATRLVPPRVLPKLDSRDGVPAGNPTMVVIPCLLTSKAGVDGLAQRLELHYLANPDAQLRFALLTDFADAKEPTRPEDDGLIEHARAAIQRLNALHTPGQSPRFFLFHRKRLWNAAEGVWMGWERKRGKLEEFFRLLRGAADTSYTVFSDRPSDLTRIKFVLTLDADTVLPRDAARLMVAALAHPLNRAVLSPDGRRVVRGYAVLQPRVSFLYRTGFRSLFARVFAGSAGVDPYSAAVSDTYMDLFGRGTFTGKGLIDVDAFAATAGKAFPDNAVLSHDLIESNYAGCALASDVEVFDEFPARYHAYAKRDHRWIRGDWQLLPWLGPRVPTPEGKRPNVLPLLERWKVADNLRRSLTPAALVLALVTAWLTISGAAAWVATLLLLAVPATPLFIVAFDHLTRLVTATSRRSVLAGLAGSARTTAAQVGLNAAFLLFAAHNSVDAIIRTLWRVFVSRRRMLEWETAAAAERRLGQGLMQFARVMGPSALVAIAPLVARVTDTLSLADAAVPVLIVWALSPVVAYLVSRPGRIPEPELPLAQRSEARRVARKTWRFFERFVGPEDNWLPPDNYQENPKGVVAHRTSPTNIGLLTVSTLAAHDLGYLTMPELVARLEGTLDTLRRAERFKGHLYNWYDTRTLEPLRPRYVSVVDSGNLLASLVALAWGCREKAIEHVPGPQTLAGLADEARLLKTAADFVKDAGARAGLEAALDALIAELDARPLPPDRAAWAELYESLRPRFAEAEARAAALGVSLDDPLTGLTRKLDARVAELAAAGSECADWSARLERLAEHSDKLAAEMEFRFLYDGDRNLFSIGYNVEQDRLDGSRYDLIASEACLTSFLTVARGEVPRKHWFQLGRLVTQAAGRNGLVSWGGTMFEYLMPRLFLPIASGTLLDRAHRTAVARQIEYGREKGVPWGISESGFYFLDASQDYQYQSFGVPGLGLKRGLTRDLVIAPYATLMAVTVEPAAAIANLAALAAEGGEGPHGFYEAIDFTADRVPDGARRMVVQSYMAHHQGMALVALANMLTGGATVRRFRADPRVQAAELLLDERAPTDAPLVRATDEDGVSATPDAAPLPLNRRIASPDTVQPRTHLLSNGSYSVMLTNAGTGYSACAGQDVTRWRCDPTVDRWGQFVYLRDAATGETWSAGHQPVGKRADRYEVTFSIDKAEIRRYDGRFETVLEVAVSPERDVEVRRLTLINGGDAERVIDVTSFSEIALMPHSGDAMHPAFGKLFLETEWLERPEALLCRRRPRQADQSPVWAVHVVTSGGEPATFETDRGRFLGRLRDPSDPAGLRGELGGTAGPVLDPVFVLRKRVTIAPGSRQTLSFSTGFARSRDDAAAIANEFQTPQAVDRVFEMAWVSARLSLRALRLTVEEFHLYQRLAGHVLFPPAGLRPRPAELAANRLGQSGLWPFGISGDAPIALVRIGEAKELPLLRQLLAARALWRARGFVSDLVVLNEEPTGYADDLQNGILAAVRDSDDRDLVGKLGGVHAVKADITGEAGRSLLLAVARVVLSGDRGNLGAQIDLMARKPALPGPFGRPVRREAGALPLSGEHLASWSGWGGFADRGREYVIRGETPCPAPWCNVVANPHAGFLATDSGGGFTWAGNSQTNRLTPWSNDPVSDPPGETVWVRDDDSGAYWSPTPLPCGGPTEVRHGQGLTRYRQGRPGLVQDWSVGLAPDAPVKIGILTLENTGDGPRTFTVTFAAELVLGGTREVAARTVTLEEAEGGALLARNTYSTDFGGRVAFIDVSRRPRRFTADRAELLGRNGHPARPPFLTRAGLSGSLDPNGDPVAAVQVTLTVPPRSTEAVAFVLGQAEDAGEARTLAERYRDLGAARSAVAENVARWDHLLSRLEVSTPSPEADALLNRWLLYQALACRVWGRSAFYQSGGAYGFRDQLQDAMALAVVAPEELRAQLLRAAARQFVEGDVQHWWHPPAGQGIRTRFSDDFLWLPLAAAHYVTVTGDSAILDEVVPYIAASPLPPDHDEVYGLPRDAGVSGSLYEHCVKAIRHFSQLGEHGLPLMGCGDWNDGMNKIGAGGRGESVWVAWFRVVVQDAFRPLAEARGDAETVLFLSTLTDDLVRNAEANAWDGEWYRRAYFDDGTPLGARDNFECRIDSLPQSWAVLCGRADPERARTAMAAAERELVRRDDGLILLFDPPFDTGTLQPGYIKGYVPGIRENGGQYTHAAIWFAQAVARQGRGADAFALFELLNPASHARNPEDTAKYRVEPYVVAADVYGVPPHTGRGGWTWYTGSASWLYRLGVEEILGVRKRGDRLTVTPCIPPSWPGFSLVYRHGEAVYRVSVENPHGRETGPVTVWLDDRQLDTPEIPLDRTPGERRVRVVLG